MADTFGALALPLVAPGTGHQPGDAALGPLSSFCAAILNAYGTTAWQSVAPGMPCVRVVYTHDPTDYVFNERDLPALYVTRAKGKAEWLADDWAISRDTITAWWVFPTAQQATQRVRDNITNGIVRLLQAAIARGSDPAWQWSGDARPTSTTLPAAPTAVRLAHATPTSSTSYSGAALDGAIGAGAVSPPRPVTLTLGGDDAAWTVGSTLTVHYLDRLGFAREEAFTVGALPHTFSTAYDATHVVGIDVDAQADTTGTLSAGLGAYTGHGSPLLEVTGATWLYLEDWRDSILPIQMSNGGETRNYDALELTFSIVEKYTIDETNTARFTAQNVAGHGPFVTLTRDDGSAIESSDLPTP